MSGVDLERLRGVLRSIGAPASAVRERIATPHLIAPAPRVSEKELAAALGAQVVDSPTGACLLLERVVESPRVAPDGLHPLHPEALRLLAGEPPGEGPVIFLDLETTGIAGGAGTVAFLVGLAFFDEGVVRIRQWFLPRLAAERALLDAVAAVAGAAGALVTYNGKAFDLPLLTLRWQFHRVPPPLAGTPHLDLLHPARRFWGEGPCRLVALERALFGVVRPGEIPAHEIPARYVWYLRTGDVGPLSPVFEHNQRDLASLAALTLRACRLVTEGPAACRRPRECLALGRLYERGGETGRAIEAYHRAATWPWPDAPDAEEVRVEAWSRLARVYRRSRRYAEAAAAWRRLLAGRAAPPRRIWEAWTALAVHHEHRLGDLQAARAFAERALRLADGAAAREAARVRLTRLARKLARKDAPPSPAPLAALFEERRR